MLSPCEPSYLLSIHFISKRVIKRVGTFLGLLGTVPVCCSAQVLLCHAFGSRLHNSMWGHYLALIAESFDYFRSDVTVWLNYLIYLVWHIGAIRSIGQISSICFILACMDGFTGQVNTPPRLIHSLTQRWLIIKFYKLIWTFWGTWGSLLSSRNHC